MPTHNEAAQATANAYFGDLPAPQTETLRDRFAMAALTGLIASNDEGAGDRITDIPGYAYDIADAMIKERQARE